MLPDDASETIGAWLESSGLGIVSGLAQALSKKGENLGALREMSDDDIAAAIASLSLRGIMLRKVQTVLGTLRTPAGQGSAHAGFDFTPGGQGDVDLLSPRRFTPPSGSKPQTLSPVSPPPPVSISDPASPVPVLAMSSVGDDEEAPIFTSRTATTTKAAAFEAAAEEAPPTFTPRSLAVPKTAAVAGNDAPVFTPRSSDAAARSQRVLAPPAPAQSDDAPVFTPRSFGAVVETAAGAGEDALIFTPRTTADVDPLANPVSAADDPIFTPRALSAGNAGNLHPAIVTAGAVTDFASLSVEEDEFASSEAAAAAKMAELSGRPSPSRPPANDAPSARAGTATPSPKSTSRSPKASTRSPSESARSTTSTPKGGKKKASPAAGSGKKAAAGNKAKKASAAKKGELSFTVVIQGQSGEISRMATKVCAARASDAMEASAKQALSSSLPPQCLASAFDSRGLSMTQLHA